MEDRRREDIRRDEVRRNDVRDRDIRGEYTDDRTRRDDRYDRDRHLFRLSELDDYHVADDDPDVRGWDVVDRNNLKLGTIQELIVDPDREKVRYLDIAPGRDRTTGDDHVLIPIGLARIDGDDDRVIVNEIDSRAVESFPVFRGDTITRDYEHGVMDRLNKIGSGEAVRRDTTTDDFYNNRFYDEDRFYSDRRRKL